LKPKIVLWIYAENTLGRANQELQNHILSDYFQHDGYRQNLMQRQVELDAQWQHYLEDKLKSHSFEPQETGFHWSMFLRLHYVRHYYAVASYIITQITHKGDGAENKQRFSQALEKAHALTQHWGGRFYVVYLTTPYTGKSIKQSDHAEIIAL